MSLGLATKWYAVGGRVDPGLAGDEHHEHAVIGLGHDAVHRDGVEDHQTRERISIKRRVRGKSAQFVDTKCRVAVWRRKPMDRVTVHSDQGSQFTSREWQTFLRQHDLEPSMSRRGNCHDNAVAESFFQLLKRERIRRRTYPIRDDARRDVFEYIEHFFNSKRRHTNNGMLSPVDFETRQQKLSEAGV